jgi:hypothetical protein
MASGVVIGSMALLFFVILLTAKGSDFLKFRNQYVSGKSQVVEGIVTNFHSAPVAGPADESFMVNGRVFSYNVLDDDICFHDAPLHRGAIQNGLDLRIYYYDGCIQRVDLRK